MKNKTGTKTAEETGCWLDDGEMTGYAKCMVNEVAPLKKRIEELEAALTVAKRFMNNDGYDYYVKEFDKLLNPSTNGK